MCDYLKIAAKEAKEAREGLLGKSPLLTDILFIFQMLMYLLKLHLG